VPCRASAVPIAAHLPWHARLLRLDTSGSTDRRKAVIRALFMLFMVVSSLLVCCASFCTLPECAWWTVWTRLNSPPSL
jgi:hypothetical protein